MLDKIKQAIKASIPDAVAKAGLKVADKAGCNRCVLLHNEAIGDDEIAFDALVELIQNKSEEHGLEPSQAVVEITLNYIEINWYDASPLTDDDLQRIWDKAFSITLKGNVREMLLHHGFTESLPTYNEHHSFCRRHGFEDGDKVILAKLYKAGVLDKMANFISFGFKP